MILVKRIKITFPVPQPHNLQWSRKPRRLIQRLFAIEKTKQICLTMDCMNIQNVIVDQFKNNFFYSQKEI